MQTPNPSRKLLIATNNTALGAAIALAVESKGVARVELRPSTTVVSNREALSRVFCNGKLWRRPGASSAIGTIPERPWDPAPWSRAVGPATCGSPGMITAPDAPYRLVFLGGSPATLRKTASTACASSDNVT